ncbi:MULTISPECIES: LysE family translocator [unclassified Moritella]|uniref:LysE family translocator n=1 Tax=unclassified Moritella TaxID=2637987 RepID=UPI001BA952C9|nr:MULTISPECIES: LysE family translocator [unclassified Moritella]QUM86137.1 LysE family translocator [Moritella sp. 28]QUM90373.1 LysE family translocator [Moritella sp. 36]
MYEIIVSLLVVNFFGMLSPGPDMMLVLKYGSLNAKRAAWYCVGGIISGLAVHMMLGLFGISLLISSHPMLFNVVRWLGAAYLIYIGIKSLRAGKSDIEVDAGTLNYRPTKAYLDGLLCNLLNPKILMFMVAAFSQVIAPETPTSDKLLISLSIFLETAVMWSCFIILLNRGALKQMLNRYQDKINKATGGLLITLGGFIGLSS